MQVAHKARRKKMMVKILDPSSAMFSMRTWSGVDSSLETRIIESEVTHTESAEIIPSSSYLKICTT
jgi:hypothetical protein